MKHFTLEEYQKVIDYLQNSDKTFTQIGKELRKSNTQIKKINDGDVYRIRLLFPQIEFPIRESIADRNYRLIEDYCAGKEISELAIEYALTEKNVRATIYRYKKKNLEGQGNE